MLLFRHRNIIQAAPAIFIFISVMLYNHKFYYISCCIFFFVPGRLVCNIFIRLLSCLDVLFSWNFLAFYQIIWIIPLHWFNTVKIKSTDWNWNWNVYIKEWISWYYYAKNESKHDKWMTNRVLQLTMIIELLALIKIELNFLQCFCKWAAAYTWQKYTRFYFVTIDEKSTLNRTRNNLLDIFWKNIYDSVKITLTV